MKKHAYLIMAHDNWTQLEKLLHLLDDSRNDIFIHIDASAHDFSPSELKAKSACLYLIERTPVFWADYTQTATELRLLKAACTQGEYAYYHLLSGSDLPLKTQDEIHNFFNNSGKLFIGIVPRETYYSIRRVRFYHLFTKTRIYRKCKTLKAINRLLEYFQRAIGINRLKGEDVHIYDGWNWFSITDEFARYVLDKQAWIEKHFRYTIGSDELVMQSLAYNHPVFRQQLYDITDLRNGSQRYIDWQRGTPYLWGQNSADADSLLNSPYMFARKFNEQLHPDIVNQIFNYLTRNEQE